MSVAVISTPRSGFASLHKNSPSWAPTWAWPEKPGLSPGLCAPSVHTVLSSVPSAVLLDPSNRAALKALEVTSFVR